MRRSLTIVMSAMLALGLASCVPPTSSTSGSSAAALIGSSPYSGASSEPVVVAHAAPLAGATVDQAQTKSLTDYLKSHRLPLVGAQVMSTPDGQRQVILFGYVASDYGRGDAQTKAKNYLNDPSISMDNRIQVEPQLANAGASPSGPASSTGESAAGSSMPGVGAYESQQSPYAQQSQAYQYQQSTSPSMLSTIVPLLGMFGGSFGTGGFGGSFGGFGTGYGPYGGYGYPAYPAPMPGFGYGSPYAPYP